MEGLEDEADAVPPQPGQRPLAQLVDALPGQPDLPGRGPVQAAEQVQQGGLPAAARPHHRHRLAAGDVQVDPVDRAHQRRRPCRSACAARGRAARPRCPVSLMIGLLRRSSSVRRPPASADRPAAGARYPPAAARRPSASGSAMRGALRVPQPAQQLAALRVDDGQRIGQPGGRRGDQLEMELGQVGLGPADLGQPVGHPLLPGRGQLVDLAVRPVRRPGGRLGGDQPGLLQPGQRDVDLAGVHRLAERAERLRAAGRAAGSRATVPWPACASTDFLLHCSPPHFTLTVS